MHAKLILCAYMLVRAVNAAAVATNATDMTLHERAIVESGLTQGEATRRSQRYNSREVIRGHCAISMMKPVFVDPNSRRHGWATQETTAYYPCPEDSPVSAFRPTQEATFLVVAPADILSFNRCSAATTTVAGTASSRDATATRGSRAACVSEVSADS
ncbi:hypothetical protein PCL_05914 [Purpureocillium lilacinum]|uniref:Uncharacterized protein n=1 Tax=Purpureocillium lilacinum TaxID=33203 RepID=A0A2U3EL67_PURLI|nr:hypothetical protein PCL_05914 [Purpureocillium lilacinum]